MWKTGNNAGKAAIVFWMSAGLLAMAVMASAAGAKNFQTLTAGEIERRAKDYINQQLPWDEDDFEVSMEYNGRDVVLPAGRVDLDFHMPMGVRQTGRIPLYLKIKVNGTIKRRLQLSPMVRVYHDVVKAYRALNRDHVLMTGDVMVERELESYLTRNAATRVEDVVGRKILVSLKQGAVVPMNMLIKPPMVKRGDPVRLLAQKGMLKITVLGIVQEDGFKGGIVKVKNAESKKMVYGRVVDSSTVRVEF